MQKEIPEPQKIEAQYFGFLKMLGNYGLENNSFSYEKSFGDFNLSISPLSKNGRGHEAHTYLRSKPWFSKGFLEAVSEALKDYELRMLSMKVDPRFGISKEYSDIVIETHDSPERFGKCMKIAAEIFTHRTIPLEKMIDGAIKNRETQLKRVEEFKASELEAKSEQLMKELKSYGCEVGLNVTDGVLLYRRSARENIPPFDAVSTDKKNLLRLEISGTNPRYQLRIGKIARPFSLQVLIDLLGELHEESKEVREFNVGFLRKKPNRIYVSFADAVGPTGEGKKIGKIIGVGANGTSVSEMVSLLYKIQQLF